MDTRGVDPRDQTWEIKQPTYRVYFHDSKGAADEYEVEGADVADVLAWAESRSGDRTFATAAHNHMTPRPIVSTRARVSRAATLNMSVCTPLSA